MQDAHIRAVFASTVATNDLKRKLIKWKPESDDDLPPMYTMHTAPVWEKPKYQGLRERLLGTRFKVTNVDTRDKDLKVVGLAPREGGERHTASLYVPGSPLRPFFAE